MASLNLSKLTQNAMHDQLVDYHRKNGRLGTGIYSSQEGAIAETFDISKNGTLLIADLPVHPSSIPEDHSTCSVQSVPNDPTQPMESSSFIPYEMTTIPSSQTVPPIHKVFYQSIVNFTKIPLDENDQSATLCHESTCCHLQYDMIKNNDSATYALIAYNGVHVIDYFHAGMITCAVMRCESINDIQSCAQLATTISSTVFNSLTLKANINENIVFPSVVNTDMQLVKDWEFLHTSCVDGKSEWTIKLNEVYNLKSASIYARVYSRDKKCIK
uniref:Vanin C-terminal domain-containing protein n=1 Tax=Strigamia maritima TaxID=126957 RepID=T1JIP5_STRMM